MLLSLCICSLLLTFITSAYAATQNTTDLSEVYALKSLYDALDGLDWTWGGGGTEWNFNISIDQVNPCGDSWEGIDCSCASSGVCHVISLNLNSYGLNGILSDLSNFTMLNDLDLASNSLLTGDLKEASTITQLNALKLYSTNVYGDLNALANLTQLNYIVLFYTGISGDLSAVSAMTQLTYINVYYTGISGDLSSVASLSQLETLQLGNTVVSGDFSAVGSLTQLTSLGLGGLTHVSGDLNVVSGLTQLTYLELSGTSISGYLTAVSGLTQLTYLGLYYDYVVGDLSAVRNLTLLTFLELGVTHVNGDLSAVSSLTQLTYLGLYYDYYVSGDLSAINNLTQLTSIELSATSITGDLSAVSNLTQLTRLAAFYTGITGDLSAVSGLTDLTFLSLYYTGVTGDLHAVTSLTKLNYLILDDTGIGGDLSEVRVLSQLNFLNLARTDIIGNLSAVSDLTLLTILELSGTAISGYLNETSKLTQLTFLGLESTLVRGDLSAISVLTQLKTIELAMTSVSGNLNAVSSMTHLSYLSLYTTFISGNLSAISTLTQLNTLAIGGTGISGDVSALSNLIQLTYIDITGSSIYGDLGAFSTLTGLTHLGMGQTDIGGALSALSGLTKLTFIVIGENDGISGDLSSISSLTQLTYLEFGENDIGGDLSAVSGLTQLTYLAIGAIDISSDLSSVSTLTKLTYLRLSPPSLCGDLSALSSLTALKSILLSSTAISGDLSAVSSLSLNILALGATFVGGDLSSISNMVQLTFLELFDTEVYGELYAISSLVQLTFLDLYSTNVTGKLNALSSLTQLSHLELTSSAVSGDVNALSSLTQLTYLGLVSTAISGDLNATSTLTQLSYLNLYDTGISGDLSGVSGLNQLTFLNLSNSNIGGDLSDVSSLTKLTYLGLGSIDVTGDLESLAMLTSLKFGILSENQINGTIPSLLNLSSLVYLNVEDNLLTGALSDDTFPASLQVLEIANNRLSGQLPNSLLALPDLEIFDASVNCLTLELTSDVCSSTSIQYLILDGLHSAASCREVLPLKLYDPIYETKLHVISSIPDCIYSLPSLRYFHASGNGITGSLPEDATLNPTFTELVLANNEMHSAIPSVFQNHAWDTLDLSYNLFTGSLSASMNVTNNVRLKINRLSGNIPESFYDTAEVSILTDNLFDCTPEQLQQLGDEVEDKYICGSSSFNSASYLWVAVILFMTVTFFLVTSKWMSSDRDYGVLNCVHYSLTALRTTRMHVIRMLNINQILEFRKSTVEVSNIEQIDSMMQNIRRSCGVMAVLLVCIFMPAYSILSYYCGVYYYQYAWTISAAFLSGLTAGVTLFLLYTVALFAIYFYNRVSIKQSLSYDRNTIKTSPIRYLIYFTVFVVNLVVVASINGAYVIVLFNYNATIISLMEIFVSVFKIVWTNYILSSLIKLAEVEENSKADAQVYQHLNLLVILSIVNNIVQPCLVTFLLDPNCFYNVIYSPTDITSTFYKSLLYEVGSIYSGDNLVILNANIDMTSTTSYTPSFAYSYQCSSIILTSFSTVQMYSALFAMILPPVMDTLVPKVKKFILGKVIAAPSGNSDDVIVVDSSYIENSIVAIVGSVSILVTFGAMQPLLGFLTFISIAGQTKYKEYRIGIYISSLLNPPEKPERTSDASSKVDGDTKLAELDKNLVGLSHILLQSLWQVLLFMGPFFGFLLFDIIGDEKGFKAALWAPIALIASCTAVYFTPHLMRSDFLTATKQMYSTSTVNVSLNSGFHSGRESTVDAQRIGASPVTLNPMSLHNNL